MIKGEHKVSMGKWVLTAASILAAWRYFIAEAQQIWRSRCSAGRRDITALLKYAVGRDMDVTGIDYDNINKSGR
jgi:hypothetical protein